MSKNNITARVWFTLSAEEILPHLNIPGLTVEFISDVCRYNTQRMSEAVLQAAHKAIQRANANVVAIAAPMALPKTTELFECVVVLGGTQQEIEKLVGHEKSFEMIERSIERKKPTRSIER